MSHQDGVTPLDHALNDGEDFELCLTVSADDAARFVATPQAPARIYQVGSITDVPGLWLRFADGRRVPLEPGGFDHLRAANERTRESHP
jgi:thiamine-monophosphate kinase